MVKLAEGRERTQRTEAAAREKMRVARALETLPRIADELRAGALSYSKVRALTRIATPETETSLLEFARRGTAAQVERLVRAWRKVDRQQEAALERARHEARFLSLIPSDDGSYEIRGRLDPEVALALRRALEAEALELYRDREPSADSTAAQRRADALGIVAEWALRAVCDGGRDDVRRGARDTTAVPEPDGPSAAPEPCATAAADTGRAARRPGVVHPDHRMVVLHVDAAALRAESADEHPVDPEATAGSAVLHDGTRVSAETSRRLACDGDRVVVVHARGAEAAGGANGAPDLVHSAALALPAALVPPGALALPGTLAPPVVHDDPVRAFRNAEAAEGLHIGPETGAPLWGGERLDLDLAISWMWRPRLGASAAAG